MTDAWTHNERGLALKAAGEYRRARAEYERGMRMAGPGDSDEAATLLHNLAGIRFVLEDPAGARRCGRRGLAMRRRVWGPDDLAVLLDEGNLAPILVRLHEYEAAGEMLHRLLERFTERGEDAEVAVTLTNLGALAAHRYDWPTARRHLERAAELKERCFGPYGVELIPTLVNLGIAVENEGGEAYVHFGRARDIANRGLPAGHPLRTRLER